MKIKFKSTKTENYENKDPFIFDFVSRLEKEIEDGYISLTFEENRNGKKITNRIEYNDVDLRIYSGVTSLTCKLNEIVKNTLEVDGISNVFFIYTKMIESHISDSSLDFKYLISHDDKFEKFTSIHLELEIFE